MIPTVWPTSSAPRINSSARRLDEPFLLGLPSKTTILIVLSPPLLASASFSGFLFYNTDALARDTFILTSVFNRKYKLQAFHPLLQF